jgi:hypothetical protein
VASRPRAEGELGRAKLRLGKAERAKRRRGKAGSSWADGLKANNDMENIFLFLFPILQGNFN